MNGVDEHEHWTARFLQPIVFITLALVGVGAYLAYTIPVSVFPSTDFPRIVVGVDNGVMPIDQMQVTITRPIEEAVNSVPGLDHVRSVTSRGSAQIDLFFVWNLNMFQTLQSVNAALAQIQATLPATARVTANRSTFAAFPIIGYSLTSKSYPPTKLWELATYTIKPQLNRLPGVATVVVQGGQEPEFQITADPAKMAQTQVTVPNILDAVSKSNLVDSPGLFEQNHQLVLGLVSGQPKSPEDLGGIVVKLTPAGVPVHLGDVAEIGDSVKPVYTVVTADGVPAVLLNINRQPESNTVAVANEVHARMAEVGEDAAGERYREIVLRSIGPGERFDQERSRCHPDWSCASCDYSGAVSKRLGQFAGSGVGDSRDDRYHVHRASLPGRKLQPDDAGRIGRCRGPGD